MSNTTTATEPREGSSVLFNGRGYLFHAETPDQYEIRTEPFDHKVNAIFLDKSRWIVRPMTRWDTTLVVHPRN